MHYRDKRRHPPQSQGLENERRAQEILLRVSTHAHLEYEGCVTPFRRHHSPYGPGEYLLQHTTPEERAILAKAMTSENHYDPAEGMPPWFLKWERRRGHPDRKEGGVLITRPTTYYHFKR